jgi:hypothetical protein
MRLASKLKRPHKESCSSYIGAAAHNFLEYKAGGRQPTIFFFFYFLRARLAVIRHREWLGCERRL